MERLLVPVDKSECAMRALDYAIGLAKKKGPIEIHIVNAHQMPVVYNEIGTQTDFQRAVAELDDNSEDHLEPAVERLKAADIPYARQVLMGDVAHEIAKYADSAGCDGIVMGTRGMGPLANLVMGSVATQVVHLTRLPVTLIK